MVRSSYTPDVGGALYLRFSTYYVRTMCLLTMYLLRTYQVSAAAVRAPDCATGLPRLQVTTRETQRDTKRDTKPDTYAAHYVLVLTMYLLCTYYVRCTYTYYDLRWLQALKLEMQRDAVEIAGADGRFGDLRW